MCGIAGIMTVSGDAPDGKALQTLIHAMAHRGPDGEGFVLLDPTGVRDPKFHSRPSPADNSSAPLALANRRLSIIDLSESGAQPMCNEDRSVWVAYNGEIYNHVELAEELKGRGHVFRSRCDTEVILHAYEEWGEDCLQLTDQLCDLRTLATTLCVPP